MRAIVLALSMCCLMFAYAPNAGYADSCPASAVGSTVVPVHNGNIRMAAEEVNIKVTYDPRRTVDYGTPYTGTVNVRFLFEAQEQERLQVGFPLDGVEDDEHNFSSGTERFAVRIQGKSVPYETVRPPQPDDGPPQAWAMWWTDFPAGQTVMDVSYDVPLHLYRPWSDITFWYILKTGQYWRGSIGKAAVNFSLCSGPDHLPISEGDVRDSTTPGWQIKDGRLTWDFRDIEPDFNMKIRVAPAVIEHEVDEALRLARSLNDRQQAIQYDDLAWAAFSIAHYRSAMGILEARESGLAVEKLHEIHSAGLLLHKKCLELRPGDKEIAASLEGLEQVEENDRHNEAAYLETAERPGERPATAQGTDRPSGHPRGTTQKGLDSLAPGVTAGVVAVGALILAGAYYLCKKRLRW